MPFRIPWTDRSGRDFLDAFLAFHLRAREEWRPESWSLVLGVYVDGEPAGTQDVRAERFAERREVETGSWLGRAFQGRGLGTEMRAAVLELAFARLGAEAAVSGAFEWNAASLRVSEKLGYRPAGEAVCEPRGVPERELVMRIERADWLRRERRPVEVEGLGPCLPLFGL